jgi:rSAM/selenodomain-associated transferase 1
MRKEENLAKVPGRQLGRFMKRLQGSLVAVEGRKEMKRALLVIAKRPTPGQTKTRLTPPLSIELASRLYECFLHDTLDLARAVPQVTRLIAYLPQSQAGYFRKLAPDFDLVLQRGTSLGERLDNALTHCLRDGFERAVIMDSDSPTLPSAHVVRAFDLLDGADVVLGPCEDGGYYLIGLNRPQPRLLREVRMSTPNVLRDTLALAEEEGLRTALAPTWYDVDTAHDLQRVQDELRTAKNGLARHTRELLMVKREPAP